MASNAGKTKGYRVRLTVFVPAEGKDLSKTKAAIEFAEKFQTVGEGALAGAPEGSVVEKCEIKPGMSGDKED